jgi:predicted nucleotide-binding protein
MGLSRIDANMSIVLKVLVEKPRDSTGVAWMSGQDLQKVTGLSPTDINDALAILDSSGMVQLNRYLGTAPFNFGEAAISPKGRYEQERLQPRSGLGESQAKDLASMNPPTTPDARSVFVVHGRNEKLRIDLFSFLRTIGLNPIEFSEAVRLTGKAAPYIGEILDAAFRNAQAVIVLLSPDDEARLRTEFQTSHDPPDEKDLTPQPRQNVLFEAGLAFGYKPERTILVKVGDLRPFSDIYGRHEVRLTNEGLMRQELASRLQNAGCAVNLAGNDWLKVGNFQVSSTLPSPEKKEFEKIGMEEAKRLALEHVKRERPESKDAKVDTVQLIGKDWQVSGHWTESGAKSFGTMNFDVVIDSETREIKKSDFRSGFAMAAG